jgi:hypothetical protein
MEITADKASTVSTPSTLPTTPLQPSNTGNVLPGNSVTLQNDVPKKEGGLEEVPKLDPPIALTAADISEEQFNQFMALLMKLLQLAGEVMETQAQNLKNRQSANMNVYQSQIGAADANLSKNTLNAWMGIAAGGLALAASAFSFKQLASAGSKTAEFAKLSKPGGGTESVTAVSDSSKLTLKALGREIDQLNTKAQTTTAAANASGSLLTSSGQMAASQRELEASSKEALANLQRKGAESLDQAVSSSQAIIDKFSSDLVASLKNVSMAAVR